MTGADKSSGRGFTVLESLVVMLIIILLVTILIPGVIKWRGGGKQASEERPPLLKGPAGKVLQPEPKPRPAREPDGRSTAGAEEDAGRPESGSVVGQ